MEDDRVSAVWARRAVEEELGTEDVSVLASGVDALGWLQRRRGDPPDLVLLDLNLPDLDGRDLLRRLRQDERLRPVPVLVLSASRSPEDIALVEAHDATFIGKLEGPEAMGAALRAVARRWGTGARPAPRADLRIVLVEDAGPDAALTMALLQEVEPTAEVRHCTRLADLTPEALGWADCVLLDLTLPDGEGLEALRGALGRAAGAASVVVLTGRDDRSLGVQAVQEGAEDYLVKGQVDGPAIARAVRYAVERGSLRAEVAHRAVHDPLTDLPNRALLLDRLQTALGRQRRADGRVALLYLDLDGFKAVNDTLGHDAGDALLLQVADRLRRCVRPSDTVARLGGDEFAILCEDVVDARQAIEVAERVRTALAEPIELAGAPVWVSTSTGIVLGAADADPVAVLRDADLAMYRAKQSGKDRWELFDSAFRAGLLDELAAEAELRAALEAGRIEVGYEDEVELASGSRSAAVARPRWRRADGTVAGEDVVEAVAAGARLRSLLDVGVVRVVFADLAAGRVAGPVVVAVAGSTLGDRTAVAEVEAVLREAGLAAGSLRVQVAGSTWQDERALAGLALLREAGVGVDRAEVGPALALLEAIRASDVRALALPADVVRLALDRPGGEEVLTAAVALLHALGLCVVAEGARSPADLERLRAAGCDGAQVAAPAGGDEGGRR